MCLVSGSGNVSQYTVEKLIELSAKPVTLSDSDGMIHDPDGIDREKLAWVMDLKNVRRGRISEYADTFQRATLRRDRSQARATTRCGTSRRTARSRARRRTRSTPATPRTWSRTAWRWSPRAPTCRARSTRPRCFLDAGLLYGPAKAANAGGVATSGLEMSQNSDAAGVVARGGRLPAARDHARDPQELLRDRREVRHAEQSA